MWSYKEVSSFWGKTFGFVAFYVARYFGEVIIAVRTVTSSDMKHF